MKEPSLKQILLAYINKTEGYITKCQLTLIAEQEGFLGETAGRELRILAGYGYKGHPEHKPEIEVDYYLSKRGVNLARYARLNTPKPIVSKPKIEILEVNGQVIAKIL